MTKNFTIFATFTVPVRKENFYHSIASTFFINEEHTLPYLDNITDRFGHSMFKHYTLIVVEEINPDPTVNKEQEPFPNLKPQVLHQKNFLILLELFNTFQET